MKPDIISIKKYKKKKQEKPTSIGKRVFINIAAILIACILLFFGALGIFEIQRHAYGFENKEELIATYFKSLSTMDSKQLRTCFYPTLPDVDTDIKTQIEYAKSEIGETVWKQEDIKTEWSELDQSGVQEILNTIEIDQASQCIAFVPLEQKLENGITLLQEDIYQFYIHQTKGKWYIAAFKQTSRNITGAINTDGTKMTEEELSKWLTSLAIEIGSDTVGYLYVDSYWQELKTEDHTDEQIKTFITSDYSSYMTMAVIKDTDVKDFKDYSANIITQSKQNYGDIIESEGVIGDYPTDVQIAQNQETGARIIVWTFKTSENDAFTHVITLESLSDYDASTYINTFHLKQEKTKTEPPE